MLRLLVVAATFTTVLGGLTPIILDHRIIGGEETTIEEFPYQVSLQSFNIPICGGTILNEYTILTAAHCTFDRTPKYLSIRAGSTFNKNGGQVIKVSAIFSHEKYSRLTQDYDFSILKLVSPLEFGPGVQAAELQESGVEVPAGTEAVISGWGRTQEGNSSSSSEILRKVEVNVITKEECQAKYKYHPISDRMLCCTSNGKDSCQGDSGGPLFSNGKLIGVVSWGKGCGKEKYAGVYAKVSEVRSWIEQYASL